MQELTLDARLESIPAAVDFVDRALEAVGCPMKVQFQFNVAIDELLSNISRYAYAPDTGKATVRFEFDAAQNMAHITFIDRGIPYDPLQKGDPDISLTADKREVGGLGIFMVKKMMDDMCYRREDGCNILRISKKLG